MKLRAARAKLDQTSTSRLLLARSAAYRRRPSSLMRAL
jgi:hypothetical protein